MDSEKLDPESYVKVARIAAVATVISKLIRPGAFVLVVLILQPVLIAYAGRLTLVDISLSVLADITLDFLENLPVQIWSAYFVGGFGLTWGILQTMLRWKTVKQLSPYQRKYEELMNANRGSSGLESTGRTNRKDK